MGNGIVRKWEHQRSGGEGTGVIEVIEDEEETDGTEETEETEDEGTEDCEDDGGLDEARGGS